MNTEQYKRRLQQLEQQLVKRLDRNVDTARDTPDDQADAGDLAQVDELRDEYLTLAQHDSAILSEVRAALARIDAGTFGRCLVDGGEIEPQRLEAVPWTPFCVKHQQELEARSGLRTPSL